MAQVEIKWTRFAEKCLDEIYDYILEETHSKDIARKVVLALIKSTEQLKKFPNSGNIEPLLKKFKQNHRYLVEGNYKVIYQYDGGQQVIITDVFHTKQNPVKIHRKKKRR